jgi:HAD superfamily hydrolase (TIGR01484 family)
VFFCALASDYDGTLAQDGKVDAPTLKALSDLKAAGKRLILITGRELKDLRAVFGSFGQFDAIVAENGAVLYLPGTQEERALAPAPPERFVAALRAKGVTPLSIGRSIVATWTPNEVAVLDAIRELGLDWQLTFNKGAVMCLPAGVNKASGMAAALAELKLSPHNVVGVGDAENDQAFLSVCGCSVAVANALESVKENADIQTRAPRGAGVAELIDRWLGDPAGTFAEVRRHDIYLGDTVAGGVAVHLPSDRGAVLISGSSGVGKSTLTHLLVERMAEHGYQVCIVDPEGDYSQLENVTHLGDPKRAPSPEEVLSVLAAPEGGGLVINLLGVDVPERPVYFDKLLGQISGLRTATGRPHWLVLDETHHLSPNTQNAEHSALPANLASAVFITTAPNNLSSAALRTVRMLIAVGEMAPQVLAEFAQAVGDTIPETDASLPAEAALVWDRTAGGEAQAVAVGKAKRAHQRHTRKYAEGRLGEDKSFYFRGPTDSLNQRAYNLATFLELAQGVDDATWLFHLKRGDYTRWFRDAIKDGELAEEAQRAEADFDPARSRGAVMESVKRRYAAANLD